MIGWAEALRDWPENYQPSYNRAPTTDIAAFRNESGELMRWGLIPKWSKDFTSKYATFNARLEGIESKPTYKDPWKNAQRCLIPMAGYYEWKGEKGNKQAFYITDRDTGGLVVAGLWEQSHNQLSSTMITRPANDMMAPLHHRMPVLLTPESAEEWMHQDNETAMELLWECNLDSMIYFPVGKAVGNTRNNSATLIEPIDIND